LPLISCFWLLEEDVDHGAPEVPWLLFVPLMTMLNTARQKYRRSVRRGAFSQASRSRISGVIVHSVHSCKNKLKKNIIRNMFVKLNSILYIYLVLLKEPNGKVNYKKAY